MGAMNICGRLSISIAMAGIFSVVVILLLRDKVFYEMHRWIICSALLAIGLFLCVAGHFVNRQSQASNMSEDGEVPPVPFFLVNMEYWGLMLAIFGVIIVFLAPLKKIEARATAPAALAENMEATNASLANALVTSASGSGKNVTLPKLRLQGVVLREPRASALINGRTYFVGDLVEGAKVLSVDPDGVVVEFQGRQTALRLNN